jgi:hypothetical protein
MKNNHRSPFPWPLLRFWSRRMLLAWSLIAFWIFLFQIIVCGIVHDNEKVKAFLQYIDLLPGFIKTMMGGDALQLGNVAGLISIGYQEPFVLLLYMLFAVGVPTALLAGEVQNGNMELILSRQVTKTHVYICTGFITIAGMCALVLVMFLGTVVATNLYDFEQEVPLYAFFKLAIVGGILASSAGGIALLAAACFNRVTAVSLTVAFLVVNYFTAIVSEWWPIMKPLTPFTIFYYVNPAMILGRSAWPIRDMAVLITLLAVSTLLGGIIWHRRDLPL